MVLKGTEYFLNPLYIPWKSWLHLYTFYRDLCIAWVFQLFETVKAALISHHAPLHCLWIHSVCIVKYVQCSSVVRRRQSLLDLIVSGADDVFKDRDIIDNFLHKLSLWEKKTKIYLLCIGSLGRQSTYIWQLLVWANLLYSLLNKKGIWDQNRTCSEPEQQKKVWQCVKRISPWHSM